MIQFASSDHLFVKESDEATVNIKKEDNDGDDKKAVRRITKASNREDSELDTPRFNTSEPGRGEIRHMQL